MAIKGLPGVLAALKKAQSDMEKKKRKALNRIGVIVKADAQKMTPVDTANLRGSAYINADGSEKVLIGYTAAYAPYVHENLDAYHKVGEAKFLEKAVKMNQDRIVEELAKGGIS